MTPKWTFLKKWWPRPNDIEPLTGRISENENWEMNETVEEYARRHPNAKACGLA